MNYDLELLDVLQKQSGFEKLVVSIPEAEALDVNLLSDLISVLGAWDGDVQFVLLLGLSTTVDLFEARLSHALVRLLDATILDFTSPRDLHYEIFCTTQHDPEATLFLGHATINILVEMGTYQGTSASAFARAIKYVYMSHFFANALALLISDNIQESDVARICEAVRNTKSFQRHAEELLDTKEKSAVKEVRRVLQDDSYALGVARAAIREGQQKMHDFHCAVQAFKRLPSLLGLVPPANASEFDIDLEALSGRDFTDSGPYISITAMLSRLRSTHLLSILSAYNLSFQSSTSTLSTEPPTELQDLHSRLLAFQTLHSADIRSIHDPSHPQHATIIDPRTNTISLSKLDTIPLTESERQYTAIVNDLLSALQSYFDTHINKFHYSKLLLHEAFVYDLKIPLSSVFTPRPRYALERALAKPGDYLGCACNDIIQSHAPQGWQGEDHYGDNETGEYKHTAPPISILWTLYREAGSTVNVRDLFDAFCARLGVAVTPDEVGEGQRTIDMPHTNGEANVNANRPHLTLRTDTLSERAAMALFYRSLSELRMLGYIRPTKKKPAGVGAASARGAGNVECVGKGGWWGL